MKAFLDTNVLVYAFTDQDPRQTRALELLESGGTISVQGLNEFVSVSRRKLKMDWVEVHASLANIEALCGPVRAINSTIQRAALTLAERHHLHIYDATILASAQDAGCDVLWSEDMNDGQRMGDLTIRNPFRQA